MNEYSPGDIKEILNNIYGRAYYFHENLSLRGNIKKNELLSNKSVSSQFSFLENIDCSDNTYCFEDEKGRIGNIQFKIRNMDTGFVLVHSQIPQIKQILNCISKDIPIIVKNGIGLSSIIRFVCEILDYNPVYVNCHSEMDVCDLLGQYQKSECSGMMFEWKDSTLVKSLAMKSLVVFTTPEYVEKPIFDRLNGLFENEKNITVYEKGTECKISVNRDCRFILCCDSPISLSPALLDRCEVIELSSTYCYIDLYKMFDSLQKELGFSLDSAKKSCTFKSIDFFRNFAHINFSNQTLDLNYDVKKYELFKKLPFYINNHIGVCNTLQESKIGKMFEMKAFLVEKFDEALLNQYKFISSHALKLPLNLSDRMSTLIQKPNTISFVKCLDYDQTNQYKNCQNTASTMLMLKYDFLRSLSHRKLVDFKDVEVFMENVLKIGIIEETQFDPTIFFGLIESEIDPLELIKKEILNEKAHNLNTLSAKISDCAKMIYKYDQSYVEMLKNLLGEYDSTESYYTRKIQYINIRLNRDYKRFIEIMKTITFCDYLNNQELRMFLEEFNDLFDYYIPEMFNNRHICTKCKKIESNISGNQLPESVLSFNLLRSGEYVKSMKYEYSKFLFNLKNGVKQFSHDLIVEAIAFDDPFDPYLYVDFTEHELDSCILNLIPANTLAQILETRNTRISLGKDFI